MFNREKIALTAAIVFLIAITYLSYSFSKKDELLEPHFTCDFCKNEVDN